MDIIKGNKLIAEFLRAKFEYYTPHRQLQTKNLIYVWGSEARIFDSCGHWWRCSFTPKDGFSWYFPTDLKYHKSYDWLIPVIEEIEKLNYEVTIHEFEVDIYTIPDRIVRHNEVGETKLEGIWRTVIKFIEWYNKQTKK